MDRNDLESQDVSAEQHGEDKMVSVSEAIRYRKRAQKAEQEVEHLNSRLLEVLDLQKEMSAGLDELKRDNSLITALNRAGAADVETALLVAKARVKNGDDFDAEKVVSELRTEKGFLFADDGGEKFPSRSSGLKERQSSGRTALTNRAKKAAASGSRNDVQEYMRARRNFS